MSAALKVVFSPEAREQLIDLYRYIADEASPTIAAEFTEAIVAHCEGLDVMPNRGRARSDVRPGLRILSYKKRVVIAFAVEEEQVLILGVFYGGQDYAGALRQE